MDHEGGGLKMLSDDGKVGTFISHMLASYQWGFIVEFGEYIICIFLMTVKPQRIFN